MSLRKAFSKKGFSARSSFSCSPKRSSALLENLLQQKSSELRRRGDEEEEEDVRDQFFEGGWSNMLPELLGDIIERVESSEERWPLRKDVVACACVCKRWRDVTRAVVKPPQQSGKITFPSSLKQPGPRDAPIQCFIKRDKKNSTFYLYLGLTPTSVENGKFLLAARKFRHGAHIEYIISLDADDLSQGSNAYIGKLSSDFLGTAFRIYDSQPPYNGAKPSNSRASRRFASKQICPQDPAETCDKQQNCKTDNSPVPARWVVMKNKAPRWHEHLQCWCLNFHGRVTVASVKNFQLVATIDPSQPGARGDDDVVVLQFGKVGDDMFTMDYRQPLSAFQAFAICLTSFGMKLACE
ncbi:hypothetical protein AAC387_Pa12g2041 [Persea americana]